MSIIILSETESVSSLRNKREMMMTRELIEGQEAATKLKPFLQNPIIRVDDGSLSVVEDLVTNVLRSFTQALSLLSSFSDDDDNEEALGGGGGGGEVVHRDLPSSGENGLPVVVPDNNYVPRCDQDSSERRKRSLVEKRNIGRGCYKRRKTAQTWTTVSYTTDDTHAWRKYGQKRILNSKFPRGYFRCSRKYEEGCRATKQVQRTQDNPDMFQITYIGIHTCKPTLSHTTNTNNKETNHPIKQEYYYLKEESPSSDEATLEDHHHKFHDHAIQWSDLEDIESSKPDIIDMPLIKLASSDDNNADVVHYSYTGSHQSLDIDDFLGGFCSF